MSDGDILELRAGDLIFCRPLKGDALGALVARKTSGPYCHVRVVVAGQARGLGRVTVVEALAQGIVRTPLVLLPDPADVAHTSASIPDAGLIVGVRWASALVGASYGFGDIAADVVKALLPRWMGSRTPFLVFPRAYDCSDLATRFLLRAGYFALPDALVDDPSRCSPNDLARALGVLKE